MRTPLARSSPSVSFTLGEKPPRHVNVNSPWIRGFATVVGSLTAWTLGRLDRYTPEHRKFLSSGFVCQNCRRTLLTKYLGADTKCYDAAGSVVPIMQARWKGKYFECP